MTSSNDQSNELKKIQNLYMPEPSSVLSKKSKGTFFFKASWKCSDHKTYIIGSVY